MDDVLLCTGSGAILLLVISVIYHVVISCILSPGRMKLNARRVLFLIAHPDDECMFFGPTIRNLTRTAESVHLLCLSSGNYYGDGRKRKQELRNSCSILGIPPGNLFIVEHTHLVDHPFRRWRENIVSEIIKKYVLALSVDAVITFDEYGVSGHANHGSLYCAVKYLAEHETALDGCKFYALESVSIIRKYCSILDILSSYHLAPILFVSSFRDYLITQKAMQAHESQLVWFRYLYLIFSRYMLINTLKEL